MTDNRTTQGLPKQEWLYCITCNMTHEMTFVRVVGAYAIYRCSICGEERTVLR